MTTSKAPTCPYCQNPAALLSGRDVHAGRPDLAKKWFWCCAPCDARVGCHGTTRRPLGVPANAELRRARDILHKRRLSPLWDGAVVLYTPEDPKARAIIKNTARKRVYEWLAWKLGIDPDVMQAGELSLDECRRAWVVLGDVDYSTIRSWAKARPRPSKQQRQETPAHG